MEALTVFVKDLFRNVYTVALIGGNVSKEWAREVMNFIVNTLKHLPLDPGEILERRITKLPWA